MRDWLQKMYPDGIGLGDVIAQYIFYYNKAEDSGHEEDINRREDLIELLNCFNNIGITPIFVEITNKPIFENRKDKQ
jgi:hypothetical protein